MKHEINYKTDNLKNEKSYGKFILCFCIAAITAITIGLPLIRAHFHVT